MQVQIYLHITSLLSPNGLEKESTNSVECFVIDQATQVYNIYLIIYVCVGKYGSQC